MNDFTGVRHGSTAPAVYEGSPSSITGNADAEDVEYPGSSNCREALRLLLIRKLEAMSTNPERTGTWQFMSVAPYVSSPERTRPIAVPDELESFFHVMLFYAIRFLPHTLGNTAQYVADYFDISQDYGNNRPLCSVVKYWVMRSGDFMMPSLNFVKNSGDPGSPLDTPIYLLLQHFKARYEVVKYESTIQQKKPSKPIPTPPGSTADEVKLARPRLKLRTTTPARRRGLGADVRTNFNVESKQPSEETRDLAERMDTHDRMARLFASILLPENTHPDEWDDVLAVQDQLQGFRP